MTTKMTTSNRRGRKRKSDSLVRSQELYVMLQTVQESSVCYHCYADHVLYGLWSVTRQRALQPQPYSRGANKIDNSKLTFNLNAKIWQLNCGTDCIFCTEVTYNQIRQHPVSQPSAYVTFMYQYSIPSVRVRASEGWQEAWWSSVQGATRIL